MPLPGTYSLLLGRPWIHAAGAVPSSLHQMVKFIHRDQMITVFAEDDHAMLVNPKEDLGASEESPVPFLAYDIISVGRGGEAGESSHSAGSSAAMMVVKELIRAGFQPGQGLGKNLQGIPYPVVTPFQRGTLGLGFQPTAQEIRELARIKRAEKDERAPPMFFPPLRFNFPRPATLISSELPDESTIDPMQGLASLFSAVITSDQPGHSGDAFPLIEAGALRNWVSCDLPVRREFR